MKADYASFQASLVDIEAALGADLSAKGLETVKPFVAKAAAAAEPLKASLSKLERNFREAGSSLRPRLAE